MIVLENQFGAAELPTFRETKRIRNFEIRPSLRDVNPLSTIADLVISGTAMNEAVKVQYELLDPTTQQLDEAKYKYEEVCNVRGARIIDDTGFHISWAPGDGQKVIPEPQLFNEEHYLYTASEAPFGYRAVSRTVKRTYEEDRGLAGGQYRTREFGLERDENPRLQPELKKGADFNEIEPNIAGNPNGDHINDHVMEVVPHFPVNFL